MTTIFLHGELADKFGPVWKLAVSSVAEAIRAIEANRPGLIAYFGESGERGVDFRVQVNEVDTTDEDRLRMSRRIDTITISPVVRGAKDQWIQVVVGIVLVIVAVVAQQYWSIPGMFGGGAGAASFAGTLTNAIGMMGVSLAIGGVANLIVGTPKMPGSSIDDGGKQSYLFNGPENTTTQGGPVPICYGGPMLVGSQVVSAGIYTEDTIIAPTVTDGDDEYSIDGPFYNHYYST